MAVIQYTGIVNQIRGKLNGSVFNRSRNVNTLQRKQQQSKGQKGYQSQPRTAFSFIQRAWKTLLPSQHADWALTAVNNPARDRFGDLTTLSGYNQFIKCNIFRHTAGLDVLGTPDTAAAAGISVLNDPGVDVEAYPHIGGRVRLETSFRVSLASYPPNLIVSFDVSLPVSEGVTAYHGRFINLYGGVLTSSAFINVSKVMSDRFPMPTDGARCFARIRIANSQNGAVLYDHVAAVSFTVFT